MPITKTDIPPVKGFSLQGADIIHYQRTEAYAAMVDRIYNQAVKSFAVVASKLKINPDKPFKLSDYPSAQKEAQKILSELADKIKVVIETGSQEEWSYANKKNDNFLKSIMDTSKVNPALLASWQDRNLDALKAFQDRKVNGLNLSQRVWKYVDQFKSTMELGIDVGIGEGTSASQLAQTLQQFLQAPDKLFRRVRDKRGNLQLSKAAKAFHPGQGTYRSSHKNAMRVTRSEINMAYRKADLLRWKKLDFVLGFEIRRSNHEYDCEVCDQLKGLYPKWFIFSGWHPACRCYMIPILQDYEELRADRRSRFSAALNGTEYKKYASKKAIEDVPQGFKEWVSNNTEKSQNWKSQPYFIRDNFKGGVLDGGLKQEISAGESVLNSVKTTGGDLYSIIKGKEDIIRMNKTFETGILFNNKGDILIEKIGGTGTASVRFTTQELSLFKDNILTHNHPLGWKYPEGSMMNIGSSFSAEDIVLSVKNDLAEIRAVSPQMRFSMKRPEAGWPDLSEVIDEINVQHRNVYLNNSVRLDNGTMTINQAQITHFHTLWKQFAESLKIEYSKEGI
jgi:hypothetical protein